MVSNRVLQNLMYVMQILYITVPTMYYIRDTHTDISYSDCWTADEPDMRNILLQSTSQHHVVLVVGGHHQLIFVNDRKKWSF